MSAGLRLQTLIDLVGDDPDVIAEIVESFRASAVETQAAVRLNAALERWHHVGAAAHKLKSGARSVGAERLGELCASLERAAGGGCHDATESLLGRFGSELDSVLRFLDDVQWATPEGVTKACCSALQTAP